MKLPYLFNLEGYCEGCPYFCADTTSVSVETLGEEIPRYVHTVGCTNQDICRRVVDFIGRVK